MQEVCEKGCALSYFDSLHTKGTLSENDLAQLKIMLVSPDAETRCLVAEVLVNGKGDQVENLLLGVLDDSDYLVRTNACDSLCGSKSPIVLDKLRKKLKRDTSALVRSYAALSIGDIAQQADMNTKELHEFLKACLAREESRSVQISLLRTLTLLGDVEHLSALLNVLQERKYQYRCASVHALEDVVTEQNEGIIFQTLKKHLEIERAPAVSSAIERFLAKLRQET
jgi:HEAT repeat protein